MLEEPPLASTIGNQLLDEKFALIVGKSWQSYAEWEEEAIIELTKLGERG